MNLCKKLMPSKATWVRVLKLYLSLITQSERVTSAIYLTDDVGKFQFVDLYSSRLAKPEKSLEDPLAE